MGIGLRAPEVRPRRIPTWLRRTLDLPGAVFFSSLPSVVAASGFALAGAVCVISVDVLRDGMSLGLDERVSPVTGVAQGSPGHEE